MKCPYCGGDEVTVYKIRVESTWYYCSEETYNRINVGDDIDNYNVVGNEKNRMSHLKSYFMEKSYEKIA